MAEPEFEQTDDRPVGYVCHDDAAADCAWATKQAKRTVGLPTGAEWKDACRGGTAAKSYTGDEPS